MTILGQLRVTARCRERLGPARSMRLGLLTLGAAFLPPLATAALPAGGGVLGAVAIVLSAAVLALGTAIVFPFEMSTIVALSGDRRVATHYGLYNTVCGVGILLGNLGTGWAMDLARSSGARAVPWLVLAVVGAACAPPCTRCGVEVCSRPRRNDAVTADGTACAEPTSSGPRPALGR